MRLTKKQKLLQEAEFIEKDSCFKGCERDLQNILVENIHDISKRCGWGEIKNITVEKTLKVIDTTRTGKREKLIFDIFILHTDDTATIIEIKKTRKKYKHDIFSAIGQLIVYGAYVELIKMAKPRLVLASNEYFDLIKYGIDTYNVPINLLTIKDDEVLYVPSSEERSWRID